jgi:hypothetical protein
MYSRGYIYIYIFTIIHALLTNQKKINKLLENNIENNIPLKVIEFFI